MTELMLIAVDSIDDHPDNPRIVFRQDVIDGIAANLNGEWPQQHALHVRKVGDRYQILSGHHRKRAAEQRGFSEVWCWVDDMDDHEAFMALATSNNQGELSPLEIGMHALKAVPPEKGGRGKKGGLTEYAALIGKSQPYVSQLKDAAEVLTETHCSGNEFMDKAKHLSAIHALPRGIWGPCCEHLANSTLTVKDVAERVEKALAYQANTPDMSHAQGYLCSDEAVAVVMCMIFCGDTDAAKVSRLARLADSVAENLSETSEELSMEWCRWLEAERPMDIADIQRRRIEFEERAYELSKVPEDERTRPQVILADPPWRYDFAETDNRQIENQYPTATVDEICDHLDMFGLCPADDAVLFLWATAPKLREALRVLEAWGFEYKTHAVWDKEKIGMGYWFRGQHELLLVGTRGHYSPPEASNRFSSVFREKRDTTHSRKPQCVYEAIEAMFPSAIRAEIYQRCPREGWMGCGNECGE